jgi:putative GTP pyrophosphokinase
LWEKARERGLSADQALLDIPDVIGVRIVCHNLSDVDAVIEMIKREGFFKILKVDDKIVTPAPGGYRAVHVLTQIDSFGSKGPPVPCEIQIRTLAQDTWARLSHADLYRKHTPDLIKELSAVMADQLAAIDKTAQLIRDELNKVVPVAKDMADDDSVNPSRLALLFKQQSGKNIYEFTLLDWARYLEEAEVTTMGEVNQILKNKKLNKRLNEIAEEIRNGQGLSPEETVVYNAMVAAEGNARAGISRVRGTIQAEWDEITQIARREIMPKTIENFVRDLKDGSVHLKECLSVFDCLVGCSLCGAEVLQGADSATEAILDYYGETEDKWDIEDLIYRRCASEGIEEGPRCGYCVHLWKKDD